MSHGMTVLRFAVGLVTPPKPRATRPLPLVTPSKAIELLALGAFSVALFDIGARQSNEGAGYNRQR